MRTGVLLEKMGRRKKVLAVVALVAIVGLAVVFKLVLGGEGGLFPFKPPKPK